MISNASMKTQWHWSKVANFDVFWGAKHFKTGFFQIHPEKLQSAASLASDTRPISILWVDRGRGDQASVVVVIETGNDWDLVDRHSLWLVVATATLVSQRDNTCFVAKRAKNSKPCITSWQELRPVLSGILQGWKNTIGLLWMWWKQWLFFKRKSPFQVFFVRLYLTASAFQTRLRSFPGGLLN